MNKYLLCLRITVYLIILLFLSVVEKKEGNTLTIEARIIPDPFQDKLFKPTDNGACSLCAAGVDVKHTVNISFSWMINFWR